MNKSVLTIDKNEFIVFDIPFNIFKTKESEVESIVRECIAKHYFTAIADDIKNEIKLKIEDLFIKDIRKEKLKNLSNGHS